MTSTEYGIDLDAILQFTAAIPAMRALGAEVVSLKRGEGCLKLEWRADLVGDPETGGLHGGVVTTLLDTASGMAAFSALKAVMQIATLDLRIDYLKPARPEVPLFADATCYKITRNIAFVRARAYQADDDQIAASLSTFMLASSQMPGPGAKVSS
jgi:uncharacterized protein (TIGR00369 family)